MARRVGEVAWPSWSLDVSHLDVSLRVMCKVYHTVRTETKHLLKNE